MKKAVLSPAARLDLLEIDLQTLELFGYDQSIANAEEFERTFRMLAENPELGEVSEELSLPDKELRIWTVLRRFVIVYEETKDALRIIRIVDGSRDLPAVLSDD